MKTIGIKLADGSFFPVMEDNQPSAKSLELTTAHNNQTKVMVDLYRSETGSMDDAEYVDSLQIDNLVSHPNGEPSITFDVSIDEDNQLSANIKDPETGRQSKTAIPFISRPEKERLIPDEYDISNVADNNIIPKRKKGSGLLSLADKIIEDANKKADSEEVPDFTKISDDEMFNTDDFLNFNSSPEKKESETDNTSDSSDTEDENTEPLADDNDSNPDDVFELPDDESFEEPLENINDDNDISEEPLAGDNDSNPDDIFELPDDESFEEPLENINDDNDISEEPLAGDNDSNPDDIFELPDDESFEEPLENINDDNDISEKPLAGDNDSNPDDIFELPDDESFEEPEQETSEKQTDTYNDLVSDDSDFNLDNAEDLNFSDDVTDLDSSDFNFESDNNDTIFEEPEKVEDETTNKDSDKTIPEIENLDETQQEPDELDKAYEENKALNDILSDDNDLSDFDALSNEEQEMTDEEFFNMDNLKTEQEDSFDLPDDFDLDKELDDFPKVPTSSEDSDYSLPDFPEDDNHNLDMPDDFFDDLPENPSFDNKNSSADPLSFTGLYDKETEMGMSGLQNDDFRKKTKAPVIICVICAIICLIATAFVFYAKYMKKNANDKQVEKQPSQSEAVVESPKKDDQIKIVEEENKTADTPEVPQAKEDEVIIIEQAEKVIPAQPEVIEEKLKDISYTVKWGDTLWDIANTFYRNPWKYTDIVEYNNIKNPDYIISGTRLTIPAE